MPSRLIRLRLSLEGHEYPLRWVQSKEIPQEFGDEYYKEIVVEGP